MADTYGLLLFGLFCILSSAFAESVSYGIGSRRKPKCPINRAQRIACLVVGVVAICLGISRLLHS